MSSFVKNIQTFSFKHNLWKKGDKIIIGVSGGPDSACLLHILAFLKEKYELELHIAHINYNLRKEDSKKDELFVKKLAKKYSLELSILKPNKKDYTGNLENSLRKIRYAFFDKLKKDLSYDSIAIAHNLDDQVETFLMKMLRGSGLNGLRAMKPKNNFVIRPFLFIPKKEILLYLKKEKIEFRIDKSNKDELFFRNKVRHKLIPYLEKNFSSAIKNIIFNMTISIAEDYSFIEKEGFEIFKKIDIKNNKKITFKEDFFLSLNPSMQKQLLRNTILKIKKDLLDIETCHIEEILKIIKSKKAKKQRMSLKGLNISKKGAIIEIFS